MYIRSTHQSSHISHDYAQRLRFRLFGFPSMETGVDRLCWNRSGVDTESESDINMMDLLPVNDKHD